MEIILGRKLVAYCNLVLAAAFMALNRSPNCCCSAHLRCSCRGVVHRDIKLDNLLLSQPIDDPQQITSDMVKVTDFGISVPFTPGQVWPIQTQTSRLCRHTCLYTIRGRNFPVIDSRQIWGEQLQALVERWHSILSQELSEPVNKTTQPGQHPQDLPPPSCKCRVASTAFSIKQTSVC